MKLTSITALALAALVLAGLWLTPSGAQNVVPAVLPATKVAVCDFGRVYNNYQKTKVLQERLDKSLLAVKAEDKRRSEEIAQIKTALESNNLKEGTKDYEDLFNDFVNKSTAHRSWLEGEKARSQRWHLKMTTEMFIEIKDAIKAVAQDRGVDIVLQTHQLSFKSNDVNELFQKVALHKVLYNNPQVDITDLVLLRINAEFAKGARVP